MQTAGVRASLDIRSFLQKSMLFIKLIGSQTENISQGNKQVALLVGGHVLWTIDVMESEKNAADRNIHYQNLWQSK